MLGQRDGLRDAQRREDVHEPGDVGEELVGLDVGLDVVGVLARHARVADELRVLLPVLRVDVEHRGGLRQPVLGRGGRLGDLLGDLRGQRVAGVAERDEALAVGEHEPAADGAAVEAEPDVDVEVRDVGAVGQVVVAVGGDLDRLLEAGDALDGDVDRAVDGGGARLVVGGDRLLDDLVAPPARLSAALPARRRSRSRRPPHAASVVAASTAARASAFERICGVICGSSGRGPRYIARVYETS